MMRSLQPPTVRVTPLSTVPTPPSHNNAHHVGNPPTSFRNPWPSFARPSYSFASTLRMRFFPNPERNYVPIPADRAGLVPIVKPDWGHGKSGLKATWIGHASWLVEVGEGVPCGNMGEEAISCRESADSKDDKKAMGSQRGIAILLDPVFSDRMSPVSFAGPKRFTPTPCELQELPDVDMVLISHNHYDHLDVATVQFLRERGNGRVRFLCALGVKSSLLRMGVEDEQVTELDWWQGVKVHVGEARTRLVCTPSQHCSARSIWDAGSGLWCSWVVEELSNNEEETSGKKLYFAGDTGYRSVPPGTTNVVNLPHCPAFKDIGELYGPFDLALLPIGCFLPRAMMSPIHCAPEDSICIHQDIRSKKSIGMHYGTVRGMISEAFEDVRGPPPLWKEAAEKVGLAWGEEISICGVGETVVV